MTRTTTERRIGALAMLLLAAACGEEKPLARHRNGFEERAQAAGIRFRMEFLPGEQGEHFKVNFYDHGSGVAAADIDGDGDDDLYFLNQLGRNGLYRNNGDGTFTDVTAEAGPVAFGDRVCVTAAFNDVDNDGDQDLYVTSTRGGNALLRNDGNGRFRDVTKEAGLEWVGHSQGSTFFDPDGDGDLDLFLSNTAQWTTDTYEPLGKYYAGVSTIMQLILCPVERNVLFRNNGDGTFTNATAEAGLEGIGWGGDCAAFDCDDDGDQDLLVANMFGGSILYRNDGKGRFEDVTDGSLGRTPWGAVGSKVFDYDGDGRLDLYVVDMHSDMWTPYSYELSTVKETRKYDRFFGPLLEKPDFNQAMETEFAERARIRYDRTFFGNGLYRNLGGGKFEEVSGKAGAETFWPWGIGAGDFDNDGFVDAYLPSGMGYPWQFWRSAFLKNKGDGTFVETGKSVGIEPPPGGPLLGHRMGNKDATRSSRSVAVSDFDGDGGLDLAVNNFNDRAWLFMNRWARGNWIAFRLEGAARPGKSGGSNRDAIGAVVKLHVGKRVMVAQVDAAGGYLAQSSKTVHFGLGDARAVDRCEIRWPGGRVQAVERPALNRVHKVAEAP